MAENQRNIWGKWQDFVTGPQGQPSNLELLRSYILSLMPQQQNAITPSPRMGGGAGGSFAPQVDLGTVNVRQPAPIQPMIPQPTVAPISQPQVNTNIRQTNMTTPEQLQARQDRNRLLLSVLFGGVAPLAMAGFGGDTGLAAGSGLAQGFGTELSKSKDRQLDLQKQKIELENRNKQQNIENEINVLKLQQEQENLRRQQLETALKLREKEGGFFGFKKSSIGEIEKKYFGTGQKDLTTELTKPARASQSNSVSRQKAVSWLQENNAMVTDANIEAVIKKYNF